MIIYESRGLRDFTSATYLEPFVTLHHTLLAGNVLCGQEGIPLLLTRSHVFAEQEEERAETPSLDYIDPRVDVHISDREGQREPADESKDGDEQGDSHDAIIGGKGIGLVNYKPFFFITILNVMEITHFPCCFGLEKWVECIILKRKMTRMAKAAAAPDRITLNLWKVMSPTAGCVACSDKSWTGQTALEASSPSSCEKMPIAECLARAGTLAVVYCSCE